MIKTEYYKTLKNGAILNRTYSTDGMMIERDGVLYGEAIDDASFGYEYNETDIPVDSESATEEDYIKALERLGVTND